MKTPHHFRTIQRIEILESRIAPAAITLSFFDKDSHPVSVTSSKGTIAELQTAVGVAAGATATGMLSFHFGAPFKGADITVVAGATTSDAILTQVGFIDAAGLDLGKVTIDGELDRINAGDSLSATAALKSIEVQTWGNSTAPTTTKQFDSDVVGAIPTLIVHGNFTGGYLVVRGSDSNDPLPSLHLTDINGKIGSLFIGGSLVGTDRMNGGHISVTGDISKATIVGSVVGFRAGGVVAASTVAPVAVASADFNGRLFTRGLIGSLLIGTDAVAGNIVGGDANSSGQVVGVSGIGSVTVKGSLLGGAGDDGGSIGAVGAIGKVVVTGDLVGGDGGARSGTILGFTTISNVTIGGDIHGGMGFNSGAIGAGNNFRLPDPVQIGNVIVGGDIIGGDGPSSGQIVSQGTIKNVTVIGSLIGGTEFETGAIGSLKGLGAILIKGAIQAGTGDRSGFITTEREPNEGFPNPADANAPIASVTVLGSIVSAFATGDSIAGFRAGGILSSGKLGPVVVIGDVVGGGGSETGRIASSHGSTSVKIGGALVGGQGDDSGTVFAQTTLAAVSIGDPSFTGTPSEGGGFYGRGILGGSGAGSGAVVGGTLAKIDVFGDLRGDLGPESGTIQTIGSGAAGKMGAVYVRGNVIGGSSTAAVRSGAIISSGAITSVLIGTNTNASVGSSNLIGGDALESGNIISELDLGGVYIEGSISGGVGAASGRIFAGANLATVSVGSQVHGGDGPDSGSIVSTGDMGPILIGVGGTAADSHKSRSPSHGIGSVASSITRDLAGGLGDHSGAVISGGKLAKIDIYGYLLAGDGPYSGRIETQGEGVLGNMGAVFIAKSLIGTFGPSTAIHSGEIFSSGKLASVTIGDPKDTNTENGGDFTGGRALGSGTIASELDLGPVKIKRNLRGGSGDESGKIISGRNIASLTVGSATLGGSILGGSGNYDTTVESGDQLGQVFAAGTIGPVNVFGSVLGDATNSEGGAYGAQIRGLSIASVTVRGNLQGGYGAHSGGFYASSLNIGAVAIDGNVEGGSGSESGFISAQGNIASEVIGGSLRGGGGTGSGYVAAGSTLGAFTANFATGDVESSRPRISAGKMITSVTINESITNTDILAGYNTSGFEFNPDAQIGKVTIGTGTGPGNMQGTNIVAGISAGSDGVFGNSDDHLILGLNDPATYSKIASVIVKGAINNTSSTSDRFGIIAENLVSVKVGISTLPLTGGALTDKYAPVGSLLDTVYGEDGLII